MAKKNDIPLSPAESVLHKWALESVNGQACLPDFDPDFSASFPNLWVFLTWTHVGRKLKQPGNITIRSEGTGWRVQYFDPSARRSCACVAPTLMDALKALDQAVVSEATVWNKFQRGKRGWTDLKD